MSTPELRKLHPLFACEIRHADLEKIHEIETIMDRYAVAVLPEQHISDEEHIAFSRRFGELEASPHFGVGKGAKVRMRYPELFDVSNLDEEGNILAEDDRRRAFRLANEMWHTDSSFVPGGEVVGGNFPGRRGVLLRMRTRTALLVLLLAGCAGDGRNLQPGVHDAPAVRAAMGTPKEILKAPHGGEIWFYPRGRAGRETWRAELGPDGKLLNVEQVLHEKNFDRIVAGKTTREELRRMLGPPDHEWLAMNGWETNWEYRYRWAQLPWVLSVGIDRQGFVTSQFRGGEYTEGGR